MMASHQWSILVPPYGCGLQRNEFRWNGTSLQTNAGVRAYNPTKSSLCKRSCTKYFACVTFRRAPNGVVVIAECPTISGIDYALQSEVNIVVSSKLLEQHATNLLLPFIILLALNFMKEPYFPREQIILQLSILIFSLEHSSVCCLFKTKLSKCLPSPTKTREQRQQHDSQETKGCGVFSTPDRGKDEHKNDLYSCTRREGNESPRMFQHAYHQRRYTAFSSQRFEPNSHMQKSHKSLLDKFVRFSPKRPMTYLLTLLLITSMFPPGLSTMWPASENESLKPHVPDGPWHCSHYDTESLLNLGAGSSRCNRSCIEKHDNKARKEVAEFERLVDKYATSLSYSAQWSLKSCKVAYKDWICSQHHKVFKVGSDGEKVNIEPCTHICRYVESSCPFFRVYNVTKLYGGQPTFLCNGVGQKATKNGTSRKECYYVHPPPEANSSERRGKNCTAETEHAFGISGNNGSSSGVDDVDAKCRPSDEVPRTIRFKSCPASSGSGSLNWRFNYLPCDVRLLLLHLFLFKIHDLIKIA